MPWQHGNHRKGDEQSCSESGGHLSAPGIHRCRNQRHGGEAKGERAHANENGERTPDHEEMTDGSTCASGERSAGA